jgi:hypothetical protein
MSTAPAMHTAGCADRPGGLDTDVGRPVVLRLGSHALPKRDTSRPAPPRAHGALPRRAAAPRDRARPRAGRAPSPARRLLPTVRPKGRTRADGNGRGREWRSTPADSGTVQSLWRRRPVAGVAAGADSRTGRLDGAACDRYPPPASSRATANSRRSLAFPYLSNVGKDEGTAMGQVVDLPKRRRKAPTTESGKFGSPRRPPPANCARGST